MTVRKPIPAYHLREPILVDATCHISYVPSYPNDVVKNEGLRNVSKCNYTKCNVFTSQFIAVILTQLQLLLCSIAAMLLLLVAEIIYLYKYKNQ